MLPKDIKRLERERAITQATRGPDYSKIETLIRAVKAQHNKRTASQGREDARHRWGYHRLVRHRQNTSHDRN